MNFGAIGRGLAPLTAGYYEGKDELMRRQLLEQQMRAQQTQQQGLAALANAYANPPQMPPPTQPLAPPPGQASQPQQPPQGVQQPQMPPGMMPAGQMGPPRQQMGAPPQQAPQAPQIKPYTAPQPPQIATPQQQTPQAAQQGIPPPPQVTQAVQSTLPDLETMASTLKKQGITGMALFAALQQHQQFLSTEGKQQLAQLQEQVRHMNAEAAMMRGGAAQMSAANGAQREDRLERSAQGETAASAAKIELLKAQAESALIRARKATSSGGTAAPEDLDAIANWVASGNGSITSLSTKGGLREKVLERALKINPNYDQKAYNADNAFNTSSMRAAGTAGANTAIASAAAQGGADILLQAAAKVPRGDFRSLNKAILAGKTEANDPDTGAYLTAINTFVNEYARAVNPKGTATVSDKEHARELLASSDSQAALEAKIAVMRQEMQRGRQAPQDVARDLRANRGGAPAAPKVGTIKDGYRFKGGDPSLPASWEKL